MVAKAWRTNRAYMAEQSRLVRYYIITLMGALAVFTLAYNYGMTTFENQPQPLLNSMEVVIQTFTTVGYGEDAPWTSSIMNVLVMGMQTAGILLIFAALPVFVIPLVEDALATTPPTTIDQLHDHVIVCTYTSRSDVLIAELTDQDVDYVLVEPDRETATTLHEQGYSVVHGDPESPETLQDLNLDTAVALVGDSSDEENVSIALAAQEITDDIHTISIVEDSSLADYHRFAGVARVFSPYQLLGQRLANKVTSAELLNLNDIIELADDFDIVEVPIQNQSPLVGKTVSESRIGEQTGAALLGAWFDGEFTSPILPKAVVDEHTKLLAVGRGPQLEKLRQITHSSPRQPVHGHANVVVAGLGDVGMAVTDALSDAEISWTALDIEDKQGVDITCDATNPEALRNANIETANTVILALPDDTETVFTTLLIRELSPDVEIIARANETENIPKLYRAGADYVLALATVSGRMVAADFLPAESTSSMSDQTKVVHTKAPKLTEQTLAESKVRTRTGVTVIAVEREGEILTGIEPSFTVQAGDAVLIAGTDEEIEQFTELMMD